VKTVLTISDSVEGTIFDLLRCTTTIKDFGLDPLAVVPRISYKDDTSEEMDVSEMLDFAFSECEFAALEIGFITNPNVISYVADKLEQNKTAPVVCCPSLISEEGEILVDGDVYSALSDRLLKYVDFLVVSTMEAEAFCGFECRVKNDFLRAAKKIFNVYGCGVFIKGDDRTDGQNILFDGTKNQWVESVPVKPGYEDKYSFLTALACEYAEGNPTNLVATLALEFVSGKEEPKEEAKPEVKAEAPKAAAPAPAAPVEEKKAEEPVEESKPRYQEEPHEDEQEVKVPVTSSLVSPGKSIRDIARFMSTPSADEDVQHAVTSNIEKKADPKGEVTNLASSRLLFDTKVNQSITDLQALKDRLNNLNKLADSGK
jgi:hydroxymethylpyrimidine/phosphomethylpyrimidine kinase